MRKTPTIRPADHLFYAATRLQQRSTRLLGTLRSREADGLNRAQALEELSSLIQELWEPLDDEYMAETTADERPKDEDEIEDAILAWHEARYMAAVERYRRVVLAPVEGQK